MNLSYVEAQGKQINISKLETGDLIKMQADICPIIYHYGIIDREGNSIYIIHNQRDFINKNGGSIIRENFNNYIKGRKLISVEKTNLKRDDLSKITELLQSHKYHFVNNNCEHFVNQIKSNKFISPQASNWAFVTVILITALIIIRKK